MEAEIFTHFSAGLPREVTDIIDSHNNAIILTVGIELAADSRTWTEEAQAGICIGFDI